MLIRKLILLNYVSLGIPVIDLTRILEWGFKGIIEAFKWTLLRAFTISLFLTVLPLAIYYGWAMIAGYIMQAINSLSGTDGVWQGVAVQLTGVSAWVGNRLNFAECLTVLLSCHATAFTISLIRR